MQCIAACSIFFYIFNTLIALLMGFGFFSRPQTNMSWVQEDVQTGHRWGDNRSKIDVCFLPVWISLGSCMHAGRFLLKSLASFHAHASTSEIVFVLGLVSRLWTPLNQSRTIRCWATVVFQHRTHHPEKATVPNKKTTFHKNKSVVNLIVYFLFCCQKHQYTDLLQFFLFKFRLAFTL